MTDRKPWFRVYVDFLTDPKMVRLDFEDQRHFIGILALKSDGALDDPDCDPELLDRIVGQRLWLERDQIGEVKRRLVRAGLIDVDWQPIAWDRRQFRSDTDPTAGARKQRQRDRELAARDEKRDDKDVSRVTVTDVTRTESEAYSETEADTESPSSDFTVPTVSRNPGALPPCAPSRICDSPPEQACASQPALAEIPLLDGTSHRVTAQDAEIWAKAYPAVDIHAALHRMVAWIQANPANRKTRRGIGRFIVGWLARDQDRARPQARGSPTAKPHFNAQIALEESNRAVAAAWRPPEFSGKPH